MNNSAKEIERKFLVEDGWQDHVHTSIAITQGYLAFASQDTMEVRVRLTVTPAQSRAVMTIKSQGDLVRQEEEFEIDVQQAQRLLSMSSSTILEKTRHHVMHEGALFEIDEYPGALQGWVVAEVELGRVDQEVTLPWWISTEVTDRPEYKNGALARDGMPVARPLAKPITP